MFFELLESFSNLPNSLFAFALPVNRAPRRTLRVKSLAEPSGEKPPKSLQIPPNDLGSIDGALKLVVDANVIPQAVLLQPSIRFFQAVQLWPFEGLGFQQVPPEHVDTVRQGLVEGKQRPRFANVNVEHANVLETPVQGLPDTKGLNGEESREQVVVQSVEEVVWYQPVDHEQL